MGTTSPQQGNHVNVNPVKVLKLMYVCLILLTLRYAPKYITFPTYNRYYFFGSYISREHRFDHVTPKNSSKDAWEGQHGKILSPDKPRVICLRGVAKSTR